MEVILLQRVENLGQMGDVVRVKDGYARNFLLPLKKALRATKDNKAQFDTQRAQLEAQNLKRRQEAEAVSGKMKGLSVTLLRQAGESGQLYGSCNARDIAEAVTAAGFTIGRQQVEVLQPIKVVGLHQVQVTLHPEVKLNVTVNVARSDAEADIQATGATIGNAFFDEGAAPAEVEPAEEAPAA
jgi:large subunit ribosomal protein L9